MKIVDELLEQHARLRCDMVELESLLGPSSDAGWDDCSNCDMAQFQASLKGFLATLQTHESYEERVLGDVVRFPDGQKELQHGMAKSHETLDSLMKLFNAASVIGHGHHVYSVRNIAKRVHDELEAHLAYEEKTLFPLFKEKRLSPSL